ncbi:hypothetical protein Gohar_021099 [Gossypium harknessii]|uniref:1,3-beta-glucan synthase n=1 Tax=Gossypium harknessii TaxID=34285 RepID=A0A7J9HZT0_9ROSI|nr:hypothetical protein [Gossypium harknessii]
MADDVNQVFFGDKMIQNPDGSFLRNVIKPIYEILSKVIFVLLDSTFKSIFDVYTIHSSRSGKCSLELRELIPFTCIYIDLYQFVFFNTVQIFHVGLELMFVYSLQILEQFSDGWWKSKINFVEVRTYWQVYRSFDRMWVFFIMALQAMIIVAWTQSGSTSANYEVVLRRVLSIFITYAILSFFRAILDVILSIHAWRNSDLTQPLRYLLKLVVAAIWAVVLPVGYSTSVKNPTGPLKFLNHWARDSHNQSLYNYILVLYMIPDLLAIMLFLLPRLREKMELSDWPVINIVMWWAQCLFLRLLGCFLSLIIQVNHANNLLCAAKTLCWKRHACGNLFTSKVHNILDIGAKCQASIQLLCGGYLSFFDAYLFIILPLIRPTKVIMKIQVENYRLHKFVPNVKHNMGVIIAIWSPIILVYFMDVQVWYTIFSTLLGGVLGAFRHLGEIRTIGMVHSRFESISSKFRSCFVPPHSDEVTETLSTSKEPNENEYFRCMWNEFIRSMRMEDLISNRDRELLLLPPPLTNKPGDQLPLFLLASKIPAAINIAKEFKRKDHAELEKVIGSDKYTSAAILDCYYTLKSLIFLLLKDEDDKKIVDKVFHAANGKKSFLQNFNMSGMPLLAVKLEKFLKILMADYGDEEFKSKITTALQEIMYIIHESIDDNSTLKEALKRDEISHKFKNINTDVPLNSEARRRITFFVNSLFMNMRSAPKVSNMRSFSVLTPHYNEEVVYSDEELNKENEDGVSTLFYLKTIYPDEWTNFEERMKDKLEEEKKEERRKWVSYRGQTLSRSVRGMMYYKKALELQCSMEFTDYISNEEDCIRKQKLPDLKFTYIISCQIYGNLKRSKDPRQKDILNLMIMYPSLRVAYIDEVDEASKEKTAGKTEKVYYSVLIKGDTINYSEREIYRIRLPGSPTKIGEGKPENQNHAIIFTRGEALQTIDMNQDNYFEEAFKMRNVLEEFPHSHGAQKPTILGLREHVFTGSVSSLAWFMSNQEFSFVTIGQRFLASPLRVRFHYGHPDIFDRIFHITRGGISKASKTINLSEDIFAGFNSTLRLGSVTHHDYMQVGKGRDVGMNQISLFEAKVANGNGEQTLTRDVHRLGCHFDFFRMLSFYCTTVGFYFNSLVTVLIVYVFLYGRLYMVMTGLEREILEDPQIKNNNALEAALVTQSVIQMGMLLVLPMLMEIGLEKGFRTALGDFFIMQLQLSSVFFTFQLGTKAHYFGKTILHGGSKYRATGRGFVVRHSKFADNYRLYSRSHFVKALELGLLLVIYEVYGESYRNSSLYFFITFSMWFLVGSWLFAPFIFNPSGFEWQKTVNDWTDWKWWMGIRGGVGIQPEKSWESWWDEEQEHLRYTSIRGRVLEILLALRFFVYQYGIVYHLGIAHHSRSLLVYGLSWCAVLVILIVPKVRNKFEIMK